MPPPIPRCSNWPYSSLNSPSCFSLPRYGSRIGLHIFLFEACSTFTRVAAGCGLGTRLPRLRAFIEKTSPAERDELVKSSTSAEESRKFQDLEDRFVSLADNERGLADAYIECCAYSGAGPVPRGAALAAEEEHVFPTHSSIDSGSG